MAFFILYAFKSARTFLMSSQVAIRLEFTFSLTPSRLTLDTRFSRGNLGICALLCSKGDLIMLRYAYMVMNGRLRRHSTHDFRVISARTQALECTDTT